LRLRTTATAVRAASPWFFSHTPPHFGRGKRRGRWPPEAGGGRREATLRATQGSLRARVARGRASVGQRARPGGAGGHRYWRTVLRDVISSDWKGMVTRTSTGLTRPRTRCASPRLPPATAQPPASRGRQPAVLLRSLRGHWPWDGTGAATGTSGRAGRLAGQRRRPISAEGGRRPGGAGMVIGMVPLLPLLGARPVRRS
jgi:hypothetical protein